MLWSCQFYGHIRRYVCFIRQHWNLLHAFKSVLRRSYKTRMANSPFRKYVS